MVTAAPPDRSVLGRRSRRKGQGFELVVRDHFRAAMPQIRDALTVRRSSQSERAYEADLIIEGPGVPQWLCDLWVECQHANDPDPPSKYAQALRDSGLAMKRTGRERTPVAIWRKTKSRQLWLTTELGWLQVLLGFAMPSSCRGSSLLITVPLSDLLRDLASRIP